MSAADYTQDKHYCTDGEICDTCWQCPECCPGLGNCQIAIDEEDAEVTA